MNESALLALADAIEDPAVNRPGIRRRREWADALRAALDDAVEFPTDHPSTCWCNGTGVRNFGFEDVPCNMHTEILREARPHPDCPACQMGGGREPCHNHRAFA